MSKKGTFLDGLVYSSLSRNLASGNSSMWELHLNSYEFSTFFEHPPFMFWIQSFYFRIFGDSIYTEHIYSLSLFALTIFIIRIFLSKIVQIHSWSSTLFFLIILFSLPIVSWSFANNMMENTTLCLGLSSAYFLIRSLKKRNIIYIIIASFIVCLNFLTKGPVTLYTLAIPIFYLLLYKNKRSSTITSLYFYGFTFLFLFTLFIHPTSKEFLTQYFDQQIIAALQGNRPEVSASRFRILKCILNNTILFIAPCILILLMGKNKYYSKIDNNFFFFILIGLSGSLPLLITTKQSCIYIMPVVPFFLFAFFPIIEELIKKISISSKYNVIIWTIVLSLSIASIFIRINQSHRHSKLEEDIVFIQDVNKTNASVHLVNLCDNYDLRAYIERYQPFNGKCDIRKGYVLSSIPLDECNLISTLNTGVFYLCPN